MAEASVPSDAELTALAARLAAILTRRGWSMAAAESCTGGWIAKCCTDLPGSSSWFDGGVVSYSNPAKQRWLGVATATLEREGAVSSAVALQMAEGLRRATAVDAAVAVTGIAGPDGGSAEKPVGTVWFAWSLAGRPTESEQVLYRGDREAIRRQTVRHALQGVLARLTAT